MHAILKIVRWVINSKPAQWALAGLAAIGLVAYRDRQQKDKGREEAEQKHTDADARKAADIQRRVADAERMPVDENDDRGYRD